MEFDNSFEVPLPPAEAWKVLLDIERIAPCMPGAELTEVLGDNSYKGKIGVRLGPVALTFAGLVKFDRFQGAGAHQPDAVGRRRAIWTRRRHHPGDRHAADEPVRQMPEGEAGAGRCRPCSNCGRVGGAAGFVAVDRATPCPTVHRQADLRLRAHDEGDLELDRGLVQAVVGWVERLRETQPLTASPRRWVSHSPRRRA
jgi:hypothetical protein